MNCLPISLDRYSSGSPSLKMRAFSGDNIDAIPLLRELEAANAIRRFSFEGKPHGAARNFCKYQKPKTPKFRPVTDPGILQFVASKYAIEETRPPQPSTFPQKGEMPRQREEGGDSLEEINRRGRGRMEEIDAAGLGRSHNASP